MVPAMLGGGLALVVDDSAEILDLVKRALGHHGARVVTAADGQEGLQLARAHLPRLVVLDLMLPRLDGFGFLEALRRDPLTQITPVIVLTAREREDVLRDPRARLADAVLQKPFRLAALLAAVDSALALGQRRGA